MLFSKAKVETDVYLWSVTNKYGTDYYIAASEEDLKDALYEYVKEWWDFLGDMLPDTVHLKSRSELLSLGPDKLKGSAIVILEDMERDEAIDYFFSSDVYVSYDWEGFSGVEVVGSIISLNNPNDVIIQNEGGNICILSGDGAVIAEWDANNWQENPSVCKHVLECLDYGTKKGAKALAKKLGKTYDEESNTYKQKNTP